MNVPLAIVVVVSAAGLAVLLMVVVRRLAGGPLLAEPTRGTPMVMMVSTAFAVLLAFVTFAAFQTFNGAKTGARSEAVAPGCRASSSSRRRSAVIGVRSWCDASELNDRSRSSASPSLDAVTSSARPTSSTSAIPLGA